jgi:hypothetical protein
MCGCNDQPLFVSLNNEAASLTNSEDGCDRLLVVHDLPLELHGEHLVEIDEDWRGRLAGTGVPAAKGPISYCFSSSIWQARAWEA